MPINNSSKTLYVTDYAAGKLYKYTGDVYSLQETTACTVASTCTVIGTGLKNPEGGLIIDGSGNVYVSDTGNGMIKKFSPSGSTYTVTTVASGLSSPMGLAFDSQGNLYVAESGNNAILKISLTTGTVTVVAGKRGSHGFSGDNGLVS